LGRCVKLGFVAGHPHYPVEHMWVRVTSGVALDRLDGILDNDPVVARDIRCGNNLFRVEDVEALEGGTR
jgi:hypothetical protein